MASKDNGNSASNTNEIIHHIPLADIFVDYDWNVRSKLEVMSDTSDAVQDTTIKSEHHGEGTGLKGLAIDMHETGQDTAVIVRKVQDGKSLGGKKTDRPFELVCGFRRLTAVEMLQAKEFVEEAGKLKRPTVPNTPNGTVRAEIRDLSPAQARILNGKENTQRKNLSTPDLVRYVANLNKADKLNQSQIAVALGIDQSYVSRLLAVTGLPTAILNHWRGDGKLPGLPEAVVKRLTSREMSDLAKDMSGKPEGEIVARYVELLNPPGPAEAGEGGGTDNVAKRIAEIGALLGTLVREGILIAGSLHWSRVIGPKKEGFVIDTGKAEAAQRGKYWDLMEEAFEKALVPPGASAGKAPRTQQQKDEAAAS